MKTITKSVFGAPGRSGMSAPALVTFASSGFPDLGGLLGYIERLKGAARLRPDSKMSVARDWPTAEARLNGALQLSRGLARVLAAGSVSAAA